MENFNYKYIDIKVSQWYRIYLDPERDIDEVLENLRNGHSVQEICEDEWHSKKPLDSTLEIMKPTSIEPTIELYDDAIQENGSLLWDNCELPF